MQNWLAELDGRRIAVEVPASSANLGAGFDCLGLALDLTNRIEVEVRGWSRGEIELSIEGVALAVVHETGLSAGRPARVRRRFPEADLVIYGHSHEPCDAVGVDGQRLFNPGSPTERRRQPWPSFGIIVVSNRQITSTEIVALTPGDRTSSTATG